MKIVLHSDSINLLSYWEDVLKSRKVTVVEDIDNLLTIKESVVIINYEACQQKCESFVSELNKNSNKVIVLDRTPELERAKKLLQSGVMGYGNALMRDHFIKAAIHAVEEEMVWLYPEFTSQLILEIPASNDANDKYLDKLTPREVEVALMLKEANTYNAIADELKISPRTVKAHAQSIYKKLNVKDRLGVALLLK